MKYAPLLLILVVVVMLLAGPGARKARAGEQILLTVGGLLLAVLVFGWILFRGA